MVTRPDDPRRGDQSVMPLPPWSELIIGAALSVAMLPAVAIVWGLLTLAEPLVAPADRAIERRRARREGRA